MQRATVLFNNARSTELGKAQSTIGRAVSSLKKDVGIFYEFPDTTDADLARLGVLPLN